jgi:hypothetical protein
MVKHIRIRIGVTSLCSEKGEALTPQEELQGIRQRLEELRKDLEWRMPDVAGEEAKLQELLTLAKDDPMVDVATQATIVRVLKDVLQDKIDEAERLENRAKELESQLDQSGSTAPKKKRKPQHVKTIHKEA